MNEGVVEADSAGEEAFFSKFGCDLVGVARASFEDEVEGAIFGVPRLGGSSASLVVCWATVGGGDEGERTVESFSDFVGNKESGRHGGPELNRGERVGDSSRGLVVGGDYFVGLDVAEVKVGQEVLVTQFFLRRGYFWLGSEGGGGFVLER